MRLKGKKLKSQIIPRFTYCLTPSQLLLGHNVTFSDASFTWQYSSTLEKREPTTQVYKTKNK